MNRNAHKLTVVLTLAQCFSLTSIVRGQSAPTGDYKVSDATADAGRRMVMESDRWRRAYESFNDWLAVQQAYAPEQVDQIKAEMRGRIAKMSPDELKQFLKEMEDRLKVLSSPEAADARAWLQQFFAVARNPEQQLGRQRPDVLNMSANEIRQEIEWVQDTRDRRAWRRVRPHSCR